MNFEDLNKIQKFCDNRMNFDMFIEATNYPETGGYAENVWNDFRENPIRVMTSRAEKNLFEYIQNQIEKNKV